MLTVQEQREQEARQTDAERQRQQQQVYSPGIVLHTPGELRQREQADLAHAETKIVSEGRDRERALADAKQRRENIRVAITAELPPVQKEIAEIEASLPARVLNAPETLEAASRLVALRLLVSEWPNRKAWLEGRMKAADAEVAGLETVLDTIKNKLGEVQERLKKFLS